MWSRTVRVLKFAPLLSSLVLLAPYQLFRLPLTCEESKTEEGNPRDIRHQIVGEYEDKIRKFSNPERVFEFFSSIEREGEFFMTPNDFIRSITPFTGRPDEKVGSSNSKYNWAARGEVNSDEQVAAYKAYLQEVIAHPEQFSPQEYFNMRTNTPIYDKTHIEVVKSLNWLYADFEEFLEQRGAGGPYPLSKFIRMVDIDGDGFISYEEYSLFTVLAGLGPSDCSLAFDLFDSDNSGFIEKEEFEKVVDALRKSTTFGEAQVDVDWQGNKRHDFSNSSLFKKFFGEDGKGSLSKSEFRSFVKELRDEVIKLKFARFDDDRTGYLDATEFSNFLVSHASRQFSASLKERASSDDIRAMDVRISPSDFLQFAGILQSLERLKTAFTLLGGMHGVTPDQFRAAAAACMESEKTHFSEDLLSVVFKLFDADGDGRLTTAEFIDVLENSQGMGLQSEREIGIMRKLKRCWSCVRESM